MYVVIIFKTKVITCMFSDCSPTNTGDLEPGRMVRASLKQKRKRKQLANFRFIGFQFWCGLRWSTLTPTFPGIAYPRGISNKGDLGPGFCCYPMSPPASPSKKKIKENHCASKKRYNFEFLRQLDNNPLFIF